jgi:hypothetical protein
MAQRRRRTLWQDEPSERVARAVIDRGRTILTDYGERYAHVDRMYRMYECASAAKRRASSAAQMRRNSAARACDDFGSEVAGNPPAMQITLRDAGFRAQEQARYYQWYQDAAYDRQKLPKLYLRATKDSWLAGLGFSICRDYDDGPMLERVHPCDVLLDDEGCDAGVRPPELVLRHRVPRQELLSDYPKMASYIDDAPMMSGSRGRDVVLCMEAWYANKRHVLACEGVQVPLVDEPWEGDWPGAMMVLLEAPRGLWGLSLMDRVASLQLARNYAGRTIQRGLRWIVPHLMADEGKILDEELTDDSKQVVRTKGDPNVGIRVLTMPAAQPELMGREQWLDSTIREEGMASELFAGGIQTDDSTSGKHLQLKRDMGVRKLLPQHRAVAEFGEQSMHELIRGEGRVSARNKKYRIPVKVSGITKNILPSLLEMNVETLQIQAKPAGALPLEATARLEILSEMRDNGDITRKQFLKHADIVEFEQDRRRETAIEDQIDSMIDDIVYEGKMRLPRTLFVKIAGQEMLKQGTLALARAELDYADDLENGSDERKAELKQRLYLLDNWLAWVAKKMKAEAQAAVSAVPEIGPPGMGPTGVPPGGGVPPPEMAMGQNVPLAPPTGNVVPLRGPG